MGKWCLHASSFIFDRIIIKVAGNQDRHKSSDEFSFGPQVSMAHLYVFWNEIWPWHIGLRWAIVALWATCNKSKSGHLHHVPKPYDWCHYPTSSGSPDILLTRLLYYTKCQSWKREIIQSNSYRILPKVNQVIYTLDTMCIPKIMIITQAVLQIFCWQGPLWVNA